MKIHLVGAKMFHVDGQTDRQTQTHTHIYEKLLLASSCLSAHTHIYIYIYMQTDMKKLIVTFHNFSKAPNQMRRMFEFPNTIPEELNIFYFLQ